MNGASVDLDDMDPQSFLARVAELTERGLDRVEIAARFGWSKATLQRRLSALGGVKAYAKHRDVIPWPIPEANDQDAEMRYLRELSLAIKGKPPYSIHHRNTALTWARRNVDAGLDVAFSEANGWTYTRADPERWHLRTVYERAVEALKRS